MPDIQVFDFLAGPIGLTQELQAGFYAWIMVETIDGDPFSQLIPTIILYQLGQNFLESYAVKGIIFLSVIHN